MIDIWVDINDSYTATGTGTQLDPYSYSQFKTRFASTTPGDI
jgi:hypothetical protein